jgi:hypothetical protein
VLAVLSLAASIRPVWAQATAPTLGTAKSFGILAGSTVTNTGPTTIHGDVGVHDGSAVTGFPPGLVILPGTTHAADAVALQAKSDLTAAYLALAGRTGGIVQSNPELGGRTLVAGVYKFGSGQPAAGITGNLTLNAQGNANAVFIFQIASTLITASNASVRLINGAQPCNVFWQVGSSATLGTNTSFIGNILALTSITVTTGASINGRALAQNGAVTLDNNNVFFSGCNASVPGSGDAGPIPGSGPGPGPINPPPPPDTPPVAGAGPVCTDKTIPTVSWAEIGPGTWTATVRDKQSGLASIVIDWATTSNTNVSIPAFAPGIKTPIVVTATRILEGPPALFGIKATDLCGNVTMWDPVEFTMNANESVTVNGISRIEHFVTITNENLQALIITINGNDPRTVYLNPDSTRTINIGGAMERGDDNTITFETVGYGRRKGQVVILVHPK